MRIMMTEENSAPYRDDTILEMIKQADIKLLILTDTKKVDNHSEWNYKSPLQQYRYYCPKTIKTKFGAYRKNFIKFLKNFNPDIVVTSSSIEGIIAKIILGCRVVLRSDTMRKGRHAHQKWNKILLTWMYSVGDAVWVPGKAAECYYEGYLKKHTPIFQGTYTNDVRKQFRAINAEKENREKLREELGYKNSDYVLLFIGKLIPTRHVENLLQSMDLLHDKEPNIKTLIIGNGPNESLVQTYCKEHSNVQHIPSVPLCALERYYAIADAYIHPGEEPYSLALYEAAVAGLPILSSQKVGAVEDCLQDGINGYLFEFCNIDNMVKCIKKVSTGELQKENLSKTQKFILENRGIEWSAKELMKACAIDNGE